MGKQVLSTKRSAGAFSFGASKRTAYSHATPNAKMRDVAAIKDKLSTSRSAPKHSFGVGGRFQKNRLFGQIVDRSPGECKRTVCCAASIRCFFHSVEPTQVDSSHVWVAQAHVATTLMLRTEKLRPGQSSHRNGQQERSQRSVTRAVEQTLASSTDSSHARSVLWFFVVVLIVAFVTSILLHVRSYQQPLTRRCPTHVLPSSFSTLCSHDHLPPDPVD